MEGSLIPGSGEPDQEIQTPEVEIDRFADDGGPVPPEEGTSAPADQAVAPVAPVSGEQPAQGQTPPTPTAPGQAVRPDGPAATEAPDSDQLAADHMTYEGAPDPDAEAETKAA